MSIKTELARLRRLVEEKAEAVRPKEIFRHIIVFEGVPLSAKQQRDLEYNHSLKKPYRVGFSIIRIQPQTEGAHISDWSRGDVQEAVDLEN